ncbi:hypothetical protein FLP10_14695 [Agromyces intestinalis]|uniref:Uncharacterized protein n=1 Tax=Agromyces intestinalis TaxID=2592652 RepID=A0A5C1YL57_9MICO|nr:hypothetical protein [Agromyces intestinalis]QEO15542.1 hypothetical protein FLP10_14695 [Agromyces intestinalis]
MSTVRIHRALAAAGVSTVIAIGLTGCFNPFERMVQQGVEDAVEGAVEGATGGDVSIGELPSGFPESEIPLIEGEVVFAAGAPNQEGEGWLITIKSPAADPVADAVAKLEAAGFTTDPNLEGVDLQGMAIRTNGTWTVWVGGDTDGVAYTVARTE